MVRGIQTRPEGEGIEGLLGVRVDRQVIPDSAYNSAWLNHGEGGIVDGIDYCQLVEFYQSLLDHVDDGVMDGVSFPGRLLRNFGVDDFRQIEEHLISVGLIEIEKERTSEYDELLSMKHDLGVRVMNRVANYVWSDVDDIERGDDCTYGTLLSFYKYVTRHSKEGNKFVKRTGDEILRGFGRKSFYEVQSELKKVGLIDENGVVIDRCDYDNPLEVKTKDCLAGEEREILLAEEFKPDKWSINAVNRYTELRYGKESCRYADALELFEYLGQYKRKGKIRKPRKEPNLLGINAPMYKRLERHLQTVDLI